MHTEQEKFDAALAAMAKAGWPVEYHNGEPLLLSEGNLGVDCFNAGYDFAATPTPDSSVLVGEGAENPVRVVLEVLNDWLEENEATDFDENDVAHLFGMLGTAGYSIVPNALAARPAPLSLLGSGDAAAEGWIDCASRMPEAVESVLALSVIPGDSRVYIARWMPHASPARWWLRDSPEQLAVVTHWMPLPSMPI